MDPAKILGQHGAEESSVSSGPFKQTKNGRTITLWVTSACIDCDQSRENCPAIYRRNENGAGTLIDEKADFFAHLDDAKNAVDSCPVTALGMRVE